MPIVQILMEVLFVSVRMVILEMELFVKVLSEIGWKYELIQKIYAK